MKALIMEDAKRLSPELHEHKEVRMQELVENLKTYVRKSTKSLFPEQSEHDESWSDVFSRLLIWGLFGLAGLCAMVLLVILAEILVWLSAELAPWLGYVIYLCWAVVIVILTPLAFVQRTKAFARIGLMIAASLFGGVLWLGSIEMLYAAWGFLAVFLGLCLLGVGVVPLAFLAALFTSDWSGLLVLPVLLVSAAGMAFVVRRMESKRIPSRTNAAEIANQSELG